MQEREVLGDAEWRSPKMKSLGYTPAHSAVTPSGISMIGPVTKSPFTSIWRPGPVPQEMAWHLPRQASGDVPTVVPRIRHPSTLKSIIIMHAPVASAHFPERIISCSISASCTDSKKSHHSIHGGRKRQASLVAVGSVITD